MRLISLSGFFFRVFSLCVFFPAAVFAIEVDISHIPLPDWSFKPCALFTSQAPELIEHKLVDKAVARIEYLEYTSCRGATIKAYKIAPPELQPPLKLKKESLPAIVYVHWFEPSAPNSNREEFVEEAVAMAKKGVVSLLVSAFWSEPGGNYRKRSWQNDYDNTQHQTRDLLRALEILRAMPEVDKNRIAYVGHDFGASFGAIVAGVDNKIAAFNLIAGTPYLRQWYLYGSATGEPDGMAAFVYVESLKRFDPVVMLKKSNAVVFFQFAEKDPYITPAEAEVFFKAAPKGSELKFYPADHAMALPEVRADREAWLANKLNLNTQTP